jgi:hypothetical protein
LFVPQLKTVPFGDHFRRFRKYRKTISSSSHAAVTTITTATTAPNSDAEYDAVSATGRSSTSADTATNSNVSSSEYEDAISFIQKGFRSRITERDVHCIVLDTHNQKHVGEAFEQIMRGVIHQLTAAATAGAAAVAPQET